MQKCNCACFVRVWVVSVWDGNGRFGGFGGFSGFCGRVGRIRYVRQLVNRAFHWGHCLWLIQSLSESRGLDDGAGFENGKKKYIIYIFVPPTTAVRAVFQLIPISLIVRIQPETEIFFLGGSNSRRTRSLSNVMKAIAIDGITFK